MSRFIQAERVGLRDRETKKIIAVYPHKIEGSDEEIGIKVKYWYYQQNCAAEEQLRNSFVDIVLPEEYH